MKIIEILLLAATCFSVSYCAAGSYRELKRIRQQLERSYSWYLKISGAQFDQLKEFLNAHSSNTNNTPPKDAE